MILLVGAIVITPWIVLPHTPVVVGVLTLVVVFAGVGRVLTWRGFSELPNGRREPPPSTR